MRYSRYLCILGLSLFCLIMIIAFKTPQTVISTLAAPYHADNPQKTVQHFWKLMDLRQIDLARDLLVLQEGSLDQKEYREWESKLNRDPLLSLQKLEFLNSDSEASQEVVVRIYWISPIEDVQFVTFSINLIQSEKGWLIEKIKRIDDKLL